MPQLDVPVIYQDDDKTCLLYGVKMMLSYYDAVPDDIDDLLSTDTDHVGTYFPQVGAWLEQRGYNTTITTAHPELFTRSAADKADDDLEALIRAKEPRSEQEEKVLSYFDDYFNAGGRVNYSIPSIDTVKEHVDAERPVGACATTWFHDDIGTGMNYHFIVATGYDENYVYVNDPNPDHTDNGRTRYTHDEFLYAVHTTVPGDFDNGALFTVTPPAS